MHTQAVPTAPLTTIEALYARAYGREVSPYPYQRVAAERDDIDVLIAPTGLGKTAAITLGWAWRLLMQAQSTPRRLVWCLPMRSLVEQTAAQAQDWMTRLASAFTAQGQTPPATHIIMGGAPSSDWRLYPERATILVGTQDMLISRALMRGYGMSRFGWPIDFGLLHTDSLWVFDEVQLMGAALATCAQLEAFRRCEQAQQPALSRSLWVSATLEPAWLNTIDFKRQISEPHVLRWDDEAMPEPPALRERLDALKHLQKAKTTLSGKDPAAYTLALAKEILQAHRTGHTTLVIVNQVRRAQELYQGLIKQATSTSHVMLLHSCFRPADRKPIEKELLQSEQPDRIIIATQAVEAGIDLTSSVLFTELAPWSSLVQRFGRCNRNGEHNTDGGATIFWIDIDIETEPKLAMPYYDRNNEEDSIAILRCAREITASLAQAAPRSLPPPQEAPPLKNVLRAHDFVELFNTDPDLSGYDLDISPYIREGDEKNVFLFWRSLPPDAPDNLNLTHPPNREELCRAPLSKELETWLNEKHDGKPLPIYIPDPNIHDSKNTNAWTRLDTSGRSLFPGMVLLLADVIGGYTADLGFVGSRIPTLPVQSIEPVEKTSNNDLSETMEGDPLSTGYMQEVSLERHLRHVETLAQNILRSVHVDQGSEAIKRAARWHDVGKSYPPFQEYLGRNINGPLLAKSRSDRSETAPTQHHHLRPYFRHELASALAFLNQHDGEPEANLVAFLIAAHHGKVRMSIRALPKEKHEVKRIARGVQDGDELPEVRCVDEISKASIISLNLMEMGEDEYGRPSWSARTQNLLNEFGPFRLAYFEALLRMADWRASAAERRGELDHE